MKTVGIIGGLGPGTTANFYMDIITQAQKRNDIVRAPVLISSVSVPYEIERDVILRNKGIERNIPYLVKEAQRLEMAGADFIVMPCNTLHLFINEIRTAVNIPVLSIIEETVKFIQGSSIKSLGIISTAATVKYRLYENEFENNGIICTTPTKEEQKVLDEIIFNLVMGNSNKNDYDRFIQVLQRFDKESIDNVILACTDLQLLNPEYPDIQIHDSMQILALATVEYMLS
jgi:aspartate racemase